MIPSFICLILPVTTLASTIQPLNYILPSYTTADVTLATTIGHQAYDRPYVHPGNTTTYEWWYFDAISSDGESSVVFQPIMYNVSVPVELLFQLVWPNATVKDIILGSNHRLYVSTRGDGSSGIGMADGGVFSWVGSQDASEYTLKVDIPDEDISGTVTLFRTAPPHVACSETCPDARLDLFWNLYWMNPVPDAVAIVDIKVGSDRLAFTRNGYHDKNWGPVYFANDLNQWYWGHGRASEYSIVWFYHLDIQDHITTSGYIAKDAQILWTAYPIMGTNNISQIQGYKIDFDAGALGRFAFDFRKNRQVTKYSWYGRWIGTMSGGRVAEKNESGVAVCEQMGPFF
ncbi:hypothetical protein IAR55_006972 [Kwoniella newhampshirensis]|uniref:AttH domain-containing protein n=1 Tax=Kwoniella newhampshirensis TaxID=1651941 RepID=A0AAW0YCR6_9TREE